MDVNKVAAFGRKLNRKLGVTIEFVYCYPNYVGKYFPFSHTIELEWDLMNEPNDLCHFFFHEAVHSTAHVIVLNRLTPEKNNFNETIEEYIAEFTALLLNKKFKNVLSKNRKAERLLELKKLKNNLTSGQIKYCKTEIIKAYKLLEITFT